MADTNYHETDWHTDHRRQDDLAPQHTQEAEANPGSAAYYPSLLGAHGLEAGVNTGVRANLMNTMQSTHGNRAVQRVVQRSISTPETAQSASLEDRIMEAMGRLVEPGGGTSSGSGGGGSASSGSGGGSGGGGLDWLTGAASQAVDWVGRGVNKASEIVMSPISPNPVKPEVSPTPGPPLNPYMRPDRNPVLEPWTPLMNPYMLPDINPTVPPFTPWNPYMQPDMPTPSPMPEPPINPSIPPWLRDKNGFPQEVPNTQEGKYEPTLPSWIPDIVPTGREGAYYPFTPDQPVQPPEPFNPIPSWIPETVPTERQGEYDPVTFNYASSAMDHMPGESMSVGREPSGDNETPGSWGYAKKNEQGGYEGGAGAFHGQGEIEGVPVTDDIYYGKGQVGAWDNGQGGTRYGAGGGTGVTNWSVNQGGSVSAQAEVATANAEASIGDDGATLGAGATAVGGSVTLGGDPSAKSDRDESVRIGVSEGIGFGGRLHWGDKDKDGHREYGFGADVGPFSFDLKSEDPLRSLMRATGGPTGDHILGKGNVTDKAVDYAGEQYEAAKESVSETYNEVSETVSDTYDEVSEKAGEVYDDASEAAGEAYDDTVDYVKNIEYDPRNWF